jgi:hypothetical protein
MIGGDLFVTAAISAKRFAEREVYVKADPIHMVLLVEAFYKSSFPRVFIQPCFPMRHGGITGVSRHWLVILQQQRGIRRIIVHSTKLLSPDADRYDFD